MSRPVIYFLVTLSEPLFRPSGLQIFALQMKRAGRVNEFDKIPSTLKTSFHFCAYDSRSVNKQKVFQTGTNLKRNLNFNEHPFCRERPMSGGVVIESRHALDRPCKVLAPPGPLIC